MEVLLFGGTWEGRTLAEKLAEAGINVSYSVATEYGRELLSPHEHLIVHTGRRKAEDMEELMRTRSFFCVVDATHPYATQVSQQIQCAAANCELPYRRVLRPNQPLENVTYVHSAQEAATWLACRKGNILLTTGSKDLSAYSALPDCKERLWVRVLPSVESLQMALGQGIPPAHVICMQGPFSQALNTVMLKQIEAKYLVTKDSGKEGGFTEKIAAAKEAGAELLVISRPSQEEGESMEALLSQLIEEANT